MAKVNIDIRHIAKLARLHVEDDEIEKFENQMAEIVGMVEHLPEFGSEKLTLDPKEKMELREDAVRPSTPRKEILKNAPKTEAGCVVVPKIVE